MTTDTDLSPARSNTMFGVRLAIGLAQGLWLYFLYRASDGDFWPATEPAFFAPQLLVALFVPVLIGQALGSMRLRTLLLWALGATMLTYGLGTYDRLRDPISVITKPDDLLPTFSLCYSGSRGCSLRKR